MKRYEMNAILEQNSLLAKMMIEHCLYWLRDPKQLGVCAMRLLQQPIGVGMQVTSYPLALTLVAELVHNQSHWYSLRYAAYAGECLLFDLMQEGSDSISIRNILSLHVPQAHVERRIHAAFWIHA